MKHKVKHIHFVGIGGAGMSGIAEVFVNLGYQVSGSDLMDNQVTQRLAKLGIKVYVGHTSQQIAGAALAPGIKTFGVIAQADSVVLRLESAVDHARVVMQDMHIKIAPDQLGQPDRGTP